MNKVDFSYKKFREYVKNRMSVIYEGEDGRYGIITDTQSLLEIIPDEVGMLTEEETLKYIYDNKLFDKLNEVIVQTTTPSKYKEAYKKLSPSNDNFNNNILQKGDVIKTSMNDNTLVLAVKKDKALLFAEDKFVIAHGIQMDGDHVFWGQGEYYDELPVDVFSQGPEDNRKEFLSEDDDWELEP